MRKNYYYKLYLRKSWLINFLSLFKKRVLFFNFTFILVMQDERAQPDPIRTIELNKVLKLPPQLLQSLRNYKPAPIARPTIPKTALPQNKVIKPPIVIGVPNAIVQTVPIITT